MQIQMTGNTAHELLCDLGVSLFLCVEMVVGGGLKHKGDEGDAKNTKIRAGLLISRKVREVREVLRGGATRDHGSRQGRESPGGDCRRVPFRSSEQARARKEDSAPTLRVSRPSRTRKRASPDTELHGSVPLEV